MFEIHCSMGFSQEKKYKGEEKKAIQTDAQIPGNTDRLRMNLLENKNWTIYIKNVDIY